MLQQLVLAMLKDKVLEVQQLAAKTLSGQSKPLDPMTPWITPVSCFLLTPEEL